jgi:predicted site-specific integrase-resolvase
MRRDALPNVCPPPTLISLRRWCRQAGVSDTTVWRYRRKGWLRCVNICGKLYLRSEDLAEFINRAATGEFAKPATGAARKSSQANTTFTPNHNS